MIEFVSFDVKHLLEIQPQPEQAAELDSLSHQTAQAMASSGVAITALLDGKPVACGGLMAMTPYRAFVWGFVAEAAGPHLLRIRRAMRRLFELHPHCRLETTVRTDFKNGHRWVLLLGFEPETDMRYFGPQGETHTLYARLANV